VYRLYIVFQNKLKRYFYLKMNITDECIEKEIQDRGLTGPRITPERIENLMNGVTYYVHRIPDTTTTIAVAFDTNGFSLATGLSACADPANFNPGLGEKIALQNAAKAAREELWRLEGYKLKTELAETK
jgi:hypothetical protein